MKIEEFLPAPDEQLFVAGQKGSGKSTLIRALLAKLPRDELVIVFDSKGEWKCRRWWETWRAKSTPNILLPHTRIKQLTPGTYIYRPSFPEYADPRNTAVLLGALKRGNCTLVIDELSDFARGANPLPILGKVIRQGRWKNVRMLIGTQRPAGVPILAITEATKLACFRLRSADDRKRMAQWADPALAKMPPGRHDFWWIDDRAERDGATLIRQNISGEA